MQDLVLLSEDDDMSDAEGQAKQGVPLGARLAARGLPGGPCALEDTQVCLPALARRCNAQQGACRRCPPLAQPGIPGHCTSALLQKLR